MKKATIAIAVSSALISSAAFAQTSDPYNLQQNLKFTQFNATVSADQSQQNTITWLVRSKTQSLAQRAGQDNRLSREQLNTAASQIDN